MAAAAAVFVVAIAFSGTVAATTNKAVSAIDLITAAAKDVTISSLKEGFSSIGTGVERVNRYEHELKLRAESLETVLKDLKSLEGVDLLETEPLEAGKPSGAVKAGTVSNGTVSNGTGANEAGKSAAATSAKQRDLGVGGGIDRRSRVITSYGSSRGENDRLERAPSDYGSKKPASTRVIQDLDFLMERIRQIPIGTPTDGEVSSEFGYRRSPFSGARSQLHSGIDISTEIRSGVNSTADGRVVSTGYKTNYGQTVIIDHGDGFETLYGHLSKITVKPGDHVCRGEEIGLVGMTGRSTGPHVHYEIRVDGIARNPRSFIELADLLKLI